jgi:hypothetical protein
MADAFVYRSFIYLNRADGTDGGIDSSKSVELWYLNVRRFRQAT